MPTLLAFLTAIATLILRASYALPQQATSDPLPGAEWFNDGTCGRLQDSLFHPQLEAPKLGITEKFHVEGTENTFIEVTTTNAIKNRQNLCNIFAVVGKEARDHPYGPLPVDYVKAFPPYIPHQEIPEDTVSFSLRVDPRPLERATWHTLFHTILGLIQWDIDGLRYMALKFNVYEGITLKARGQISQGLDALDASGELKVVEDTAELLQ